jgi:crossover junction endodeoxyribonuclease RuvC
MPTTTDTHAEKNPNPSNPAAIASMTACQNSIDATKPLTILALDLGTKTGWASRGTHGSIASGVTEFATNRWQGGGMRFLQFQQWLEQMRKLLGHIDAIYFEEVRRHLGVDAAHAYGGFLGQLTAWCEQHEIPYEAIPVGTIKRHATGQGNASKQQVIEAMRALGHAPVDDNQADALALLHCALDRVVA